MARALPTTLLPPAIALACEPCPRATEPLISRTARLWISGAAGVLLAAATASAGSYSAQAQTADCLREPTAQAPDGTHWVGRWEINYYRRCWVLVDAAGREVAAPVPAQPANPPQPAWQSFVGNVTSPSQPQAAPASPAAASPRRPPTSQPDGRRPVTTASKLARSEPPKSAAQPVKPDKSQPDRDALYAEFLRWKASKLAHTEPKSEVPPVKPDKSQQDRDALYAEFLRWNESRKLTGAK
jgi:hypothetical protein